MMKLPLAKGIMDGWRGESPSRCLGTYPVASHWRMALKKGGARGGGWILKEGHGKIDIPSLRVNEIQGENCSLQLPLSAPRPQKKKKFLGGSVALILLRTALPFYSFAASHCSSSIASPPAAQSSPRRLSPPFRPAASCVLCAIVLRPRPCRALRHGRPQPPDVTATARQRRLPSSPLTLSQL